MITESKIIQKNEKRLSAEGSVNISLTFLLLRGFKMEKMFKISIKDLNTTNLRLNWVCFDTKYTLQRNVYTYVLDNVEYTA